MNRRDAIQRTALVLGYAVSTPVLMGILKGCKSAPELTYTPVFLTPEQAALVSEAAEIIIPKTDTPGAKDVGVPNFIDMVVKDCFKKEDQDSFIKGLTEFDEEAKAAYGDSFASCKPEQQFELVKKHHDAAVEGLKNGGERPFILRLKELTVAGFFTSEPGATQVLQYSPVPGSYHGCLPLAEVGKTWAT